eukprot:5411118-Prymnesium_polylepis.1
MPVPSRAAGTTDGFLATNRSDLSTRSCAQGMHVCAHAACVQMGGTDAGLRVRVLTCRGDGQRLGSLPKHTEARKKPSEHGGLESNQFPVVNDADVQESGVWLGGEAVDLIPKGCLQPVVFGTQGDLRLRIVERQRNTITDGAKACKRGRGTRGVRERTVPTQVGTLKAQHDAARTQRAVRSLGSGGQGVRTAYGMQAQRDRRSAGLLHGGRSTCSTELRHKVMRCAAAAAQVRSQLSAFWQRV